MKVHEALLFGIGTIAILFGGLAFIESKSSSNPKPTQERTSKLFPEPYHGVYPSMTVAQLNKVATRVPGITNGMYGTICSEKYNHYSTTRHLSNGVKAHFAIIGSNVALIVIHSTNSEETRTIKALLLSNNMKVHSVDTAPIQQIYLVTKFGTLDRYAWIYIPIKPRARIEWRYEPLYEEWEAAEDKFEEDQLLGLIK